LSTERVSRIAVAVLGVYALLGGAISFLGWVLDWPVLADWDRDGIAIQPNTAIAAIFAGAALLLLSRGLRRPAALLGALTALLGASTIFQYVFGIDLGIDTLLMFHRSWGQLGVLAPGRMGPLGAISWAIIGSTILLASLARDRGRRWVPWLGLLTAAISSLSLIGYLYGVSLLYTVPTLTIIALQTATFILAASLGLVASVPESGLMHLLCQDGPAGILMRRALPVVIGTPVLIGFVRVLGERDKLYDSAFGNAIRTLCEMVLFLILLLWTSGAISRHFRHRQQAEATLRDNERRLSADLSAMTRMQRVSSRLLQSTDISSLLQEILDAAIDITGAEKGNVQLDEAGTLRMAAQRGFSAPFLQYFDGIREGLACGTAAQRRERVIVEDIEKSQLFAGTQALGMLLGSNVRAVQSTPLISRSGQVMGVFSTHYGEAERRPDERQLRMLDLLARQAADLIERRRNETEIQRSEERYRSLVSVITDVPWTADPDGSLVTPQAAWEKYTGQTWEQYRGFGWTNVLHPEDREGLVKAWRQACETRSLYASHGRMWHAPSRRYCHFVVRATPLLNADGSVREWVGSYTDVEERQRAEKALQLSQEQLSAELAAMTRLQDLSTRLVQGQNLLALLREILAAAASFTLTDKGNIQFYDPATGRLRIVVHQGLGPRLLEHFAENGCAATCGAAVRQADRVVVGDVAAEPSLQGTVDLEIILEDGIRGIQSTPLVSRDGRLLGMLNNHYRVPGRPSEREMRYLDLLARMAADVVERAQAEEALRQADRRKDEFLATLAHELRNPLAPLQNAVDILKTKGRIDRDLAWASDVAGRQVRVMARLLEDLLDVSRITRDRLELHKQRVELSSILRGALEMCGPLFEGLHHELRLDLPEQPIWLEADPVRLGQVFGNLFNNACKYTVPKGRVSVKAEERGGEAVIRIKDTGIGIPPDKLTSIFDIFSQLDRSLERAYGGLGIGLHLVKRLVEMHGGTVEARSDGEDAGSEFIVRLPLPVEGTVAAGPSASAEPVERTLAADSSGSTERIDVPETPSWRILVVDDNQDAAESLAMLLAHGGHDTETAHDGREAVEKAATYDPDIILLDIGLPGMNGYDACREIRRRGSGHEAPLMVAVTGWGQEADREKAKEAGFDAHLVKPVLHDNLMSLLASLSGPQRAKEA
jgi:PAS domain S-box-containing protein